MHPLNEPVRPLDLRHAARAVQPTLEVEPALRAAAISTWRQRMVNEYGSADVFRGLAAQFASAGLPVAEVDAVRRMADEEHHHGVLCGSVVEALGGEAIGALPPAETLPLHPEVPAIEGLTRNLLSVGCLSETVAVSLITAERDQMQGGPLKAVLTEILADEIGHARLGWRFVAQRMPSFDRAARLRLGRYLAVAFAHLEAHELRFLPVGRRLPAGAEQLGLCHGSDARSLFYATVEQVIVPRLESHGLPARLAWQRRSMAAA